VAKRADARMHRGAVVVLLVGIAASASVGAGCARGTGDPDSGGHGSPDAGPRMDGGDTGASDGGPVDAPHDANPPHDASRLCGDTTCSGFTYCMAGVCVMYPACAGDGSCPNATDVCRSHRCVPCTADLDNDGYTACMDCDESNSAIHPGATELCNAVDDDCDMMIDEGDPVMICAMDPMRGSCTAGHCGCPAGTVDVGNPMMPGCTCTVRPALTTGMTCANAIDLGMLSDVAPGSMATAMGNALPDTREVWYKFHAVDSPDTTCDTFNVHVHFTVNPGNVYEFEVLRGMCTATVMCPDCTAATCLNFTDYRYATDSRTTAGTTITGQCPCLVNGNSATTNNCTDDSGDYYVRVRRHAGTMDSCDQYTLVVSNGIM
jgi:hypothetical protein